MTPTPAPDPRMAELLSAMEGIKEPELGFQLAPGWWGLILLCFVAAVLGTYQLFQYYRRNRYRRIALKHLEQITPQANATYIQGINQLLKRTCLAFIDRHTLCELYGVTWADFLQRHQGKANMSASLKAILGQGAYQANPQFDPKQLHEFARSWIKQHQINVGSGGKHV